MMKFLYAFAVFAAAAAAAADNKKLPPAKPCTIRSPSTGAFFDLNSIHVQMPKKDSKPSKADDKVESWHARGYDYGANFTMNFCGPVVEEHDHVEGLEKSQWQNVTAFYTMDKKTYSIGQLNTEMVLRGRKLVLNYTGGSPCDSSHSKRTSLESSNLSSRKISASAYVDDDEGRHSRPVHATAVRRKSSIISLLCDKEPMAPKSPKVTVAFVGASEDECTYFFEARSEAACAGFETTNQQLGPGGVFGVIMLIAIMVYLVGGCMYQRTVMRQRGWRQLPNYTMWSAAWGFISDLFIILTSSCARFLPGRSGYSRVSLNGNSRGRGMNAEAENRLIDQLDEEWED